MGFLRAQVSIPSDTTVPADAAVNVWHFATTGDIGTAAGVAHSKLTTFYQAIDLIMSVDVASPATVKYYDLEDPIPRVPIDTDTIALTPAAGAGLPQEIAICLSYQADQISGVSQARRRGRIYLGPIVATATSSSGGRVLVHSSTVTTITAAASALAGIGGAPEAIWSVFSPTIAGPEPWGAGTLTDAFAGVTNGWVDNAFDVQRRRGTSPTIRTTWTD